MKSIFFKKKGGDFLNMFSTEVKGRVRHNILASHFHKISKNKKNLRKCWEMLDDNIFHYHLKHICDFLLFSRVHVLTIRICSHKRNLAALLWWKCCNINLNSKIFELRFLSQHFQNCEKNELFKMCRDVTRSHLGKRLPFFTIFRNFEKMWRGKCCV